LLERVEIEPVRFGCPAFADKLVGREAAQSLWPAGEVVGVDEVRQVALQLFVVFVVEFLDGGVLDRAVHSLDLTVGPRMPGLGQSMIDVIAGAGVFEGMSLEGLAARPLVLQFHWRPRAAGRIGEVDPVVGQDGVDLVRRGVDEGAQKIAGHSRRGLAMKLDESEFGSPVYRDEEIELAFGGPHFSDVDVEIANRVRLKTSLGRFVALHLRQAADSVALKAAVKR
jgi:hypothetical protein